MDAFSAGKVDALVQALAPQSLPDVPEGMRLNVHTTISKVAVLYEKIRNAIDYKDDHLLRKAAILRIIKRQLTYTSKSDEIARNLVRELIAARYLPNNTLPESVVQDVQGILEKFLMMRRERVGRERHQTWLLGITAAELEELMTDHRREKGLLQFLFEQLGDKITLSGAEMEETERRLQVYIACHRALFKADDEMLSYKLVRAYYRSWMQPETWGAHHREMALQMVGIHETILRQLKHPYAQKFSTAVKPWATSLRVLVEALDEKPEDARVLLGKPESLLAAVTRVSERNYQEAKQKLKRGMVRAMIYLFITKTLFAIAIEMPFEQIVYKHIDRFALLVNILFPPILMWIVASLIRVPGKDNTERIAQGVNELLTAEGPLGREIKIVPKRRGLSGFFFQFIYAFTFALSFGLVIWGLWALKFTAVSMGIFLFFLCVVSFFAFRLRVSAREYVIVEKTASTGALMVDFFALPILRAGQWLSNSISRINVFIFIFDFIIEAPLKLFLNILEEWFAFMKERKEELQ